jgi:aldehyde dehydrogenase (NAD+)
VGAAEKAFAGWRRSPAEQRAEVLIAAAEHLSSQFDKVATDLALEQGKTLREAQREVAAAIQSLRYFAGQATAPIGDVLPLSARARRIWAERVPIGPVACITPWNFPLLIPTYKTAAAIAYGNTAILKPASLTPGAATHLIEAFVAAAIPDGVVNMCLGEGSALSASLIGDSRIRGVSFTGSTEVGHALKVNTADSFVRTQLEMGGKNPLVVLEDADIEIATDVAVQSALGMAGQRCTAVSRAIVQKPVAADFCQRLIDRVRALRVGHPLDPQVDMGPVISSHQR